MADYYTQGGQTSGYIQPTGNNPNTGKPWTQEELNQHRSDSYYTQNDMMLAELAKLKKNASKPDRPEWQSMLGEDGKLKENLQLKNNLDTRTLDALRGEALRTGPSAARGLQQQNINLSRDQANQQANTAAAQAADQMAMRGGVSRGANERLQYKAAQQQLMNAQQAGQQGLQADIADENKRMTALAAMPGMDQSAAAYGRQGDQYNIDKTIFENLQKRASDINFYNEDMRAWGSERTAAATPSSGGKK